MDFITSGVAMMMIGIRLMNRPRKSYSSYRIVLVHHAIDLTTSCRECSRA